MKKLLLTFSHVLALAIGFALGIYFLPILTAPDSPSVEEVNSNAGNVQFTTQFTKDLKGSDLFHWGEGQVSLSPTAITFMGKLAPGPDYKLYLTKSLVETEEDFEKNKDESLQLGDIKTFDSFIVPISNDVNLGDYNSVLVWCESFSEFITSAQYK